MEPRRTRAPMSPPPPPPPLPAFLDRYVYVARIERLWDRLTRNYLTVLAAVRRHGHEVSSKVNVENLLLRESSAVDKVDAVTFAPKQPETFKDNGAYLLNLWTPSPVKAVEGDATLFTSHLAHVFDHDDTAVNFVLDYFAHLIQRPERKISSAILLVGDPGTGKSMIANVMADLVGRSNTAFVSPTAINSDFNDWIEAALLVIVNELVSTSPIKTAGNLKEWITEESILVNRKGVPAYRRQNCAHFLLLSNDRRAILLDRDDRRYFVWDSKASRRPTAYYQELADWLSVDGLGKVLHLLQTRDISGFNPFAAPPRTGARDELESSSISDSQAYLVGEAEAQQGAFAGDLLVINHAVDFYRYRNQRVTIADIKAVLERIGATNLGQKRNVGGPRSKPHVWAIRNAESWLTASEAEIAAAYMRPGSPAPQDMTPAPQPVRRIQRL